MTSADTSDGRDLLGSWKEIAAYLGRSVRAVQNWEKEEGLPVHRHQHDRQGTVFAYRSELDAWLRARPEKPARRGEPSTGHRLGAVALTAALLVTFAAAVWWIVGETPSSMAIALPVQERALALVSDIDNRTSNPVFNGSIEYLLGHELSQSSRLSIVPRERAADALKLMKRPVDTKIDRAIGREVALRDGGIHVVIAPRIDEFGDRLVIGVEVIDPKSGERLGGVSEDIRSVDAIPTAVRRLGRALREGIGEKLPPIRDDERLAKVTTGSLRAAQLFTEADRVIAFRDDAMAEKLLLRAIEEDPEFASAHMHLAHAVRNQGRPAAEYLPHAERAAQLSAGVSDRERHFILGGYASMRDDDEETLRQYRTLLRLYPDHFWATSNIAHLLKFKLARNAEAIPYRLRAASLRPNEFFVNAAAGESLLNWSETPERAEHYFARALELLTDDSEGPGLPTLTRLSRAQLAWTKSDHAQLIAELQKWTEKARSISNRGAANDLLYRIGLVQMSLGRLDDARQAGELIKGSWHRLRYAAHLDAAAGDCSNARRFFESLRNQPILGRDAALLIRCRVIDDASAVPPLVLPASNLSGYARALAEATLKARAERSAEAISRLEQLVGHASPGPEILPLYCMALQTLIADFERQNRSEEAITLLERTSAMRTRAFAAANLWLELQRDLARLLRKRGDEARAAAIEGEVKRITGG